MRNIFIVLILLIGLFSHASSATSFDLYVYIGQSIELRCVANESTTFTRIQHILPNGTVETLLSNDKLNADLNRNSELHIEKLGHIYILKIEPVRLHSAGVYTCEDDVSLNILNKKNHIANLTVHVIGVRANNPVRILSQESNNLLMYQNNYQKKNTANRDSSTAYFHVILTMVVFLGIQI